MLKDKPFLYNQMIFEQFLKNTISSYCEDTKGQRFEQFFMNALAEYDIELYSRVPKDVDCFYDKSKFCDCTDWLRDNWVDTCETVHDSSQ